MKFTNLDTAIFLEQLSMIISSGLSLSEGIDSISQEIKDQGIKKIFDDVINDLDVGMSLYDSLNKTNVFDPYMVSLIRIGEITGYLEQCLNHLAEYYYRLDEIQQKIKEALLYPSIIFIMMFIVIGIIVIKVLPVFKVVLNNLGAELSASAILLMNIGEFISKYGFIILLILGLFIIISFIYYFIKYKEEAFNKLINNNIFTHKLAEEINTSKFAYAISLLLNSGFDLEESLKAVPDMLNDEKLGKKVQYCLDNVPNKDIGEALIEANIFKSVYNRMLKIGIKTGKLDDVMSKIAMEYEKEVDSSINRFLDIIEPSLIFIAAIIVGMILLSVMLPLMSIMSSIG